MKKFHVEGPRDFPLRRHNLGKYGVQVITPYVRQLDTFEDRRKRQRPIMKTVAVLTKDRVRFLHKDFTVFS